MLTAIASLGDISDKGLMSLVDRSGAKDCIEIVFDHSNCSFIRCNISANKGEDKYLYHKEPSGKPGLFLSWTISAADIKLFQELSKKGSRTRDEEKKLEKFWENKFRWFSSPSDGKWFSKNKLINNQKLIGALDKDSRSLLLNICKSYAKSSGRICKEAEGQLRDYEFSKEKGSRANKLLVTIAFKDRVDVKYPADIEPFTKLFMRAVSGDISGRERLICTVCNSELGGEVHIPAPVEFITLDQLVYVPSGDSGNKGKAIALCQTCSDRLRAGQAFINSALSFRVLQSKLFFWLIPVVPQLAGARKYLLDLAGDNKPIYLTNLRNMCNGLDLFTDTVHGSEENSKLEAWLTFTSVFCFKDSNGHTRITGTAEGIYPSRLRELADAAKAVQHRYPYLQLDPKVMFSFPLLSEFFKQEKGETTLTQVMESLFVKNPVNPSRVFWIVTEKIRSEGLTRLNRKKLLLKPRARNFVITVLKALIVIEYLLETNVLEVGGARTVPLTENSLKDMYVDEIRKFVLSHEYLNRNRTTRSVFLTGVTVGVLLEIQMKDFGSYPFWKHLNRLELDMPRIISFYPQVKAKLVQYSKGKAAAEIAVLRPMIEYIGANLDFESEERHDDRDSVDFAFAVGLSEGYLVYHMVGGMRQ